MSKGNCYEANFKELCLDNAKNYGVEWVLVHAMREILEGSEWWGGHAFLLNRKTNEVHDFSNGKHEIWDKEEIYKKWNVKVHGLETYFEYSKPEAWEKALDTETYGAWELKFENWTDKDWHVYMQDWWIPNMEPRRHALEIESKKKI